MTKRHGITAAMVCAVALLLGTTGSARATVRQFAGQGSPPIHVIFHAKLDHGEPSTIRRFTWRVPLACKVGGRTTARGHLHTAMPVVDGRFWGRSKANGRHVHVRGHLVEGLPGEVHGSFNLHGRVDSEHSRCSTGHVRWFASEGRGPASVHYARCRPGRHLKGKLLKHHVPCPRVRRMFRKYFPVSRQQVGAITYVEGFACVAPQQTPPFHIRCHRRAPNGGLRRTKFVGVPR